MILHMQDPKGQANACCQLGKLYYQKGQLEQAVTYYEKFFELARSLGERRMLDVARISLGVARASMKVGAYMAVVNEGLNRLLEWKNMRVPFAE